MPIMLAHLNDALRKAGVDDDLARKASEEVAGYENRLATIEIKLVTLDAKVATLDAKVMMLQWMVGLNMAMTVAILFKVLGD